MKLKSKASLQILKPVEVVFEAIVNPEKMTNYFISESTGPMEVGKEVLWKFPEFEESYPVKVIAIKENESISFVWDPETEVNIRLESQPNGSTVIRVTEGEKELNQKNLDWALNNSGGWANFLACLKAYLEHGINLRKGSYDFMRKKEN